MSSFPISVDLSFILPAVQQAVDEKVLPHLSQSVRAVAQVVQTNWMNAVYQARLWQGEKTAYMESIQVQMTGPFSALVWSDYRLAEEIETGRPARDLKRMLDTSQKVRATKDGRRFLVIPFRHNTPGNEAHGPAMPTQIYEQARQLAPSSVTGKTTRMSGLVASDTKTKKRLTVPQNTYQWGQKLPGAILGPNQKGKTDRFSGMYRFNTSSGGGKSSKFLTFRVMMEGSQGWIVPPQPGLHLAQKVASDMQPLAETAFQEAMKRDLG